MHGWMGVCMVVCITGFSVVSCLSGFLFYCFFFVWIFGWSIDLLIERLIFLLFD